MIFRIEHPKPQFMRENWLNLNGSWQFEFDHGNSGKDRGLFKDDVKLSMNINVPFCPESKLSGIEYVDFMSAVWYKREIELTAQQLENRVILHFGAVDHKATVFINSVKCGTHKGGYSSFCFDITDLVKEGVNTITVYATDDARDRHIPSGKQSSTYHSRGCFYTRTTGIWQTVWLEFVPKAHIKSVKYFTDINANTLSIHAKLCGQGIFKAVALFDGKIVGNAEALSNGGEAVLNIQLSEQHLWQVGQGNLYDLVLTFGDDRVNSYFGMRSLRLDGNRFLINEKSVFQRLVLDQGFYPDGVYTAPSDDELIADIERSLAMGFNGARLHEKVFEERFLYHCDRLGYIVWGEYPNWGFDYTKPDYVYDMLPEWMEVVERDFNHPAIIGWCPFNENWDIEGRRQYNDMLVLFYNVTKAMDSTRPFIDTSGNYHVKTDIYDLHNYEQDPQKFKEHFEPLGNTNEFTCGQAFPNRQRYDGKMPFFVSEYGGIRWTKSQSGWGYGKGPESEEEFINRLKGLTDVLIDNPNMFGLCYTQLTDVEQEQNGLYTYDRKPKFDPQTISKIFSRKAAIED